MLARGSTANVTLTINPANGFSGTVSLACTVTMIGSGAATTPTCSLNPSQVILGTGASTTTLTINAANQSSRVSPVRLRGFTAFLVFGAVLLSAVPIRKCGRSRGLYLLLLAGVLVIAGCGGGGSKPVTPPPTTTFSVITTASIGNASASNAITVTVQ